MDSLTSSHNWSIQPCSARYTPSEPSIGREGDQNYQQTDPRIIEGLDWVVREVSKRVYYGTQPVLGEVEEGVEKREGPLMI